MVETNKTHFGHVYGYGLVVLWVTTMLWTAIATLISTPFDIGMAVQTSFLTLVFCLTNCRAYYSYCRRYNLGGNFQLNPAQ